MYQELRLAEESVELPRLCWNVMVSDWKIKMLELFPFRRFMWKDSDIQISYDLT